MRAWTGVGSTRFACRADRLVTREHLVKVRQSGGFAIDASSEAALLLTREHV